MQKKSFHFVSQFHPLSLKFVSDLCTYMLPFFLTTTYESKPRSPLFLGWSTDQVSLVALVAVQVMLKFFGMEPNAPITTWITVVSISHILKMSTLSLEKSLIIITTF